MDLTNKRPHDTFQYLITTDGTHLYNGSGSLLTSLTITSITSSYITSSIVSESVITASAISASQIFVSTLSASTAYFPSFSASWAVSSSQALSSSTSISSSFSTTASFSISSSRVSASGITGGVTQELHFTGSAQGFTTMSFVNGVLVTVI